VESRSLAEEKLAKITVTGSDDTGILDIPLKLFNPYRILALKILYLHGDADFRELKSDLKTSDGKLASHLKALEQDGYIMGYRRIVDKMPRTSYHLTRQGLDWFRRFRACLWSVVQDEPKT
jgi:DNA-binding HxlR family transcriptional regulator